MSNLRPSGVPIMVEGVERHFLFTLNAIDEIQDHYNISLSEALEMLINEQQNEKTLRYFVTELLNDEALRAKHNENEDLKVYTEQEIGWIIDVQNKPAFLQALFSAYGVSLPEPEEDEELDPNQMSGQMTE